MDIKPTMTAEAKMVSFGTTAHNSSSLATLGRDVIRGIRLKLYNYPWIMRTCRSAKKEIMSRIVVWKPYIHRSYKSIMNQSFELVALLDKHELILNEIEINKNCDLDCIMCNTQLSTRKQQNMSLELFDKIMRMLRHTYHSQPVPLHTIGEPLINPLLEEYLKIARRHRVGIFLSTNGQSLDRKMDILFRNADIIQTLRFSIDGASKETYEKIRIPGKFDRLIQNLELFTAENRKGHYIKDISMSSIVSTDVQHELAYHLKFYSRFVPMENINLGLVNGLSPDNSYFFKCSILKNHIVPNRPCKQLHGNMQVLADGRISACCRDYNADLIYGDIRESTPQELLNGPAAIELRKCHIENRIPEDLLCSSCYTMAPKVHQLFDLFCRTLVLRHRKAWDIEKMQERFDLFFNLFASGIPSLKDYLSLVR